MTEYMIESPENQCLCVGDVMFYHVNIYMYMPICGVCNICVRACASNHSVHSSSATPSISSCSSLVFISSRVASILWIWKREGKCYYAMVISQAVACTLIEHQQRTRRNQKGWKGFRAIGGVGAVRDLSWYNNVISKRTTIIVRPISYVFVIW